MTTVYVGGLDPSVTIRDLDYEFNRYGRIISLWKAPQPSNYAFVQFASEYAAQDAVRGLDGRHINGRRATVRFSRHNRHDSSASRNDGRRNHNQVPHLWDQDGEIRHRRENYGSRDHRPRSRSRSREYRTYDHREYHRGDFRDSRRENSRDRGSTVAERTEHRVSASSSTTTRGHGGHAATAISRWSGLLLLLPYDGLRVIADALPRQQLVERLYELVTSSSSPFVHINGPPASGKTSLLQLFQQYCATKGIVCIDVSMASKTDFQRDLLLKAGINAETWRLEADNRGYCVCGDTLKNFVVVLDNAQLQYHDAALWTKMIKRHLPENIRFVISGTLGSSTLGVNVDPVEFCVMPTLTLRDLRLSPEEVDDFIRMSSYRLGSRKSGALLANPVIASMIAQHCNGHVGAVAVSVMEVASYFRHNNSVTVEDMVTFYMSTLMQLLFSRCYCCGEMTSLPDEMRNSLVDCLTEGPLSVVYHESPGTYDQLVRSGVLEEAEDGRASFTSPAAASFIHDLLFPRHLSVEATPCVEEQGIAAFMISVVAKMSASMLQHFVDGMPFDVPTEANFRHALHAALEAQTPVDCLVFSELSKYFPPSLPRSQELSEGRCDFYLNILRWVVEVLIQGRYGTEPVQSRLENEALPYVGLNIADSLVVDIHVNATGEPMEVQAQDCRRMCVFFKKGDFRVCTVVCGGQTERVSLAP